MKRATVDRRSNLLNETGQAYFSLARFRTNRFVVHKTSKSSADGAVWRSRTISGLCDAMALVLQQRANNQQVVGLRSDGVCRVGRKRGMTGWVGMLLAGISLLLVQPASAQLPASQLFALYPPGGKQGTQVEVKLPAGADLEGVDRLVFSHEGITAQVSQDPEGKPIANQFQVTIAEAVPPGIYEARAVGTYGMSNPRAFVVGQRPEVQETEANNEPQQATQIPLGSVVNGVINGARDIDWFKFTATKGQRVIIDCWAERIDSRLDGTLRLYDASGRMLSNSRDNNGREPLLDVTIPEDGEYRIQIYDFQYGGGNEFFYRLNVDVAPYLDFVLPASGVPGTKSQYTIYGRNLPAGTPVEGQEVDGQPLEKMTVEIELPGEDAAVQRVGMDTWINSTGAQLDGIEYRMPLPQGAANPLLLGFATAPVVLEQEPNNQSAESQVVTLPCEISGQFQDRGDVDSFTFEAKKGQVYWIEVLSQRLGAPTDSLLVIQQVSSNEAGEEQVKELKAIDDNGANVHGIAFNTASDDPLHRFAVPEDGTYRVVLRDLHSALRGDPRYVYRLSMREERPDFRLVSLAESPVNADTNPRPWTAALRKGGTATMNVLAIRSDGFNGEIQLTVEGLPSGVHCAGATIGPGRNNARLVFVAAEDAPNWAGPVRISGQAVVGDTTLSREVRGGAIVWPATGRDAPNRLTRNVTISVMDEVAPFLLTTGMAEVRVPQGHQLDIPLKATRRGDFKEQLVMAAIDFPANVVNETVTLAGDQTDATLRLFVQQNAPPGTYTLHVQSTVAVPYTKNPEGKDKKNINTVIASTPVQLTIVQGPLTLAAKVPDKGTLKRGAQIEIPVAVDRRDNFAGPVTLKLSLPPGISGVEADPVTVAPEAKQATLVVKATAEATEGNHKYVTVRAVVEHEGAPLEIDQVIPLNITK
jgi:hypothetical protein